MKMDIRISGFLKHSMTIGNRKVSIWIYSTSGEVINQETSTPYYNKI